MRRMMAILVLCAVPASAAQASHKHHHPVCERITHMRAKATHRHGHRAIGRNLCTEGVHDSGQPVRKASRHELWNYYRQLRILARPAPPYLHAHAGHPRQPGKAGVYSLHYRPIGLARCIVYSESRNDTQADNGSHKGLAQWSQEAWFRMGGGRYASSPLGATRDEQLLILSHGLVHWGCRDWCPYDPC